MISGTSREGPLQHLIGIGFKIGSALAFTIMGALVKILSETVPIGEIVFFRSLFALPPLLVWLVVRRELPGALHTRQPMAHFWRAVVGLLGMVLNFYALSLLPLPNVTAIIFVSPLIVLPLAAIFLGERAGIYRWSAVGVGLFGVLVILSPNLSGGLSAGDGAALGSVSALSAAVMMAVVVIHVRNLTKTESTGAIVFYFSAYSTLLGLATLPFGWILPGGTTLLLLVLTGLIGGVGQILITQSYKYAPASVVAPFEYTTMIWSLLLGFFVFGDVPQLVVLVGATIVIAANIFVILRERRLGIERDKARKAGTYT
ncbi:DMT family transporter [Lutibaculum baratangense]|uniref:Membrane protein n=1 Tax=Lutibaculum baratangense AMV1 TaxID=631454 RepID=V4RLU9_9HYPH|nr:DMT family transporter [Lutibaculum baratangense]ESR24225.1 Membrane protein [Lutibaculum baratangense AMV1]